MPPERCIFCPVNFFSCAAKTGVKLALEFHAKETFLNPIWDEGWKYVLNGLGALAIGSAGGAAGAVFGVLLARRQLSRDGEQPDYPPVLTLPVLGLVGAFVGSIIAAGVWGAVVVAVLLLAIGVLAAQ